jgi:aminopeptidase
MSYQPNDTILQKYADVLVNFALNSGSGVKAGETVLIQVPESAKPLYRPLRNAVLKAGANPIMQFLAENVGEAEYYEMASEEQLTFFPAAYLKGTVDQIDHSVAILAEFDKYVLKDVDPKKILARSNAFRPYKEWREEKEAAGKFTWTLALYGTEAMAHDVGMSIEEYWQQIIAACYLDQEDPVAEWRATFSELERIRTALNTLAIEKVHVEGEGTDLWLEIGPNRHWLGGSGRNIPSFELFISPDWRGTEGVISFNQPLYRYGNKMEGIRLVFHQGIVTEAVARAGQSLLQEMIASENANKIGEFSLTDGRFSKITSIMGETLFDENIGGPEGNTHIAIGSAYKDSYCQNYPAADSTGTVAQGNLSEISKQQWEEMGFNDSPVHCDIISTTRRTVTAYLTDGSTQVIYKDGVFTV